MFLPKSFQNTPGQPPIRNMPSLMEDVEFLTVLHREGNPCGGK